MLIACFLSTAACGASRQAAPGTSANRRQRVVSVPVSGDSAAAYFARALDDLDTGLYPEALKEFAELKAKFPYSRYAALADLRIADTHYRRGKYVEAIDGYRNFLKYHPNHDESPYAMFKIGEAYFHQMPTDWWILPPAAEKDQASTERAIAAYEDVIARYGDTVLAGQARERLRACHRALADHEIYVSRFYFKRGHYKAAAGRAEWLLARYPGLGLDADALWIAARSYVGEGDSKSARRVLSKLVREHRDSVFAGAATDLLTSLASPHNSELKPASPESRSGPAVRNE